jgi:membrane-associated phospholipid phosphatase
MSGAFSRCPSGLFWILMSLVFSFAAVRAQEPAAADSEGRFQIRQDTVFARYVPAVPPVLEAERRPGVQDMFTNVPGDWVSAVAIAVDGRSLAYLAGIGCLTGMLIATDHQTEALSKRVTVNSETVQSVSRAIVCLGDGRTHLGIAAGFALYGLAWDDSRAIRTGSETVESLISCGIAVQVFKRIAGRESPQVAASGHEVWRWFPNIRSYQEHQPRYYAFPSGHISTAMATLTVIAENYPEATWLRPVGYSLMACLGVSPVNVGYHWYSDFPLGIAMGCTFGMIAARRHENLFASLANDSYSGLRVLPSITQHGSGVTLALLF